jgi:hypothetical protein
MPFLGTTLLTSAYMMVNHDAHTFTLWEANPTTEEDPVLISSPKESCTPTPSSNSTSSGSSGSDTGSSSHSGSSSLSGGAIAGIVIGAAVLLATLAGALWFFCFHKQRRQARGGHAPAESKSNQEFSQDLTSSSNANEEGNHELHGDTGAKEMPPNQPVYELPERNRDVP